MWYSVATLDITLEQNLICSKESVAQKWTGFWSRFYVYNSVYFLSFHTSHAIVDFRIDHVLIKIR